MIKTPRGNLEMRSDFFVLSLAIQIHIACGLVLLMLGPGNLRAGSDALMLRYLARFIASSLYVSVPTLYIERTHWPI